MIDKFSGEFKFLSNFYRCDVRFGPRVFPSSEHAYQSSKTIIPEEIEYVRRAIHPSAAKKAGRVVTLREDWDEYKLIVMCEILRNKFSNSYLGHMLCATDDAELVEGNYWNDTYWGICCGQGENHLGKLLMEIRDELNLNK